MAGLDFGDERQEIIGDFIVETDELIERLDQELVQLEERSSDPALLNSIFRAFHTIKGTSSFLGFKRMTELTHKAENILNELRNGTMTVSAGIMDVTLDALDGIRILLNEIRAGEEDRGKYDPTPVMARLIALVESKGAPKPAAAPGTPPAAPAISGGMSIDDILASAPKVEPKIEVSGKTAQASAPAPAAQRTVQDDIDAILASAPMVQPKITVSAKAGGEQEHAERATRELEEKVKTYTEKSDRLRGKTMVRTAADMPTASEQPAGGAPVAKTTGAIAKPPDPSKGVAVEQTIRVDVERLDALMNLAGELVLGRNRLANITRKLEEAGRESETVAELSSVVASISLVAGNLQTAVMKTRMQPIGKVFNRFPRMVRDLARDTKKMVDLTIVGADTEVDKSVIEAIGDPLVHLIRNAIDHGIEPPETRRKLGKPETGAVTLSAEHEGNHVVIRIVDDGKGIDPVIIKRKAVEKKLFDEATVARMTDREARMIIFMAGFSTAEAVTNTSGRGVGMDVVKTNIEGLGGIIDVQSEVGKGSRMVIKLPLTLAIIEALMVRAGGEVFAISLANVTETVRIAPDRVQSVEGRDVVRLRDSVLPIIYLGDVLDCPDYVNPFNRGPGTHYVYVVVLALGEQRVGLAVDGLLGQEEVVIKSLGDYLDEVPGIAGSTILGDGRIALIVDVVGLVNTITLERQRAPARASARA